MKEAKPESFTIAAKKRWEVLTPEQREARKAAIRAGVKRYWESRTAEQRQEFGRTISKAKGKKAHAEES